MILKGCSWSNTKDYMKIESFGFGIFDFYSMVKDRDLIYINGNV